MSVRVQWKGLQEFLREFGSIPKDLQSEGMDIIRDETEGAAIEMARAYPRKSGNLAKSVRTFYPSSTILVGIARAASPHSHLFEFGTKRRETNSGSNRGTMPAQEVTVPIARRRRSRMARRLVDLLRRKGFKVGNE
jgi:hypothetical protein